MKKDNLDKQIFFVVGIVLFVTIFAIFVGFGFIEIGEKGLNFLF